MACAVDSSTYHTSSCLTRSTSAALEYGSVSLIQLEAEDVPLLAMPFLSARVGGTILRLHGSDAGFMQASMRNEVDLMLEGSSP